MEDVVFRVGIISLSFGYAGDLLLRFENVSQWDLLDLCCVVPWEMNILQVLPTERSLQAYDYRLKSSDVALSQVQ